MKRRNFVKNTSALTAGGLLLGPSILSAGSRRISQNDNLQIGVIGCNGMGWSNTHSILQMEDVNLVAICDVDNNVVNRRLEDYKELRKNKPKAYSDYRELLNDESIDAVIIGTPDHWHCRIMVDAVNAGKHVYVEKPIANTIQECRIMMEAA